MQYASLIISLAGDPNNTAIKHGVSAAEALALKACHGEHSVALVPGTIEERRSSESPQAEHARLTRLYGEEPVENCFGKCTFNTRLPSRFSEVGIETGGPDEAERPPGGELSLAERSRAHAADKALTAITADAKAPVSGGIADALAPAAPAEPAAPVAPSADKK